MFDPAHNVEYAANFLKALRAEEGNWTLAVARYNAGPDNPRRRKIYVCAVIALHGGERHGTVDAERARILQIAGAGPGLAGPQFHRPETSHNQKVSLFGQFPPVVRTNWTLFLPHQGANAHPSQLM